MNVNFDQDGYSSPEMYSSYARRNKVYVEVEAHFSPDGTLIPTVIIWEDGRRFFIERITDIRQAVSMRAGGQGDRYTIWISGRQSFLFFERSISRSGNNIGKWFVERRV